MTRLALLYFAGAMVAVLTLLTLRLVEAQEQTPPPYESFRPCPVGNDCDEDGWINPRETRAQRDPFDACSIPPDFNADGRVSLADVILFGPWWNTTPPADATEYARFDLFGDGLVNLTDLVMHVGPRYNTANC